jgi:gliding motility-associated-like protein
MQKLILILLFSLGTSFSWGQSDVRIPNVFTPNNDAVNDVFKIRADDYVNLTCTIYNRYGSIVYKYFGINGTWDGYTHAGVKVSAGSYFVIVELYKEDPLILTETIQSNLTVQY